MPNSKRPIAESKSIVTSETFRFFRDLSRNNRTEWMDSNRDRYKQCVVQPLRALCEELAPAMLKLDPQFETSGRTGANLSRINRDIRFAKDKTPYRTGMYVKFSAPFDGEGETGQLYVGISAKTVTSGFRIYSGSKRKDSALAQIADARVEANPRWIAQQKKRLGGRYESYWYGTEKGEWKQSLDCAARVQHQSRDAQGILRRTRKNFPRLASITLLHFSAELNKAKFTQICSNHRTHTRTLRKRRAE